MKVENVLEVTEIACSSSPLDLIRTMPEPACTEVNVQLDSVRAVVAGALALMMAASVYVSLMLTFVMVVDSVALVLSMALVEVLAEVLAKFAEEIVTSLNRRDGLAMEKRPLAGPTIFDTVMASTAKGFAGAASTAVWVHVSLDEAAADASTKVYALVHVVAVSSLDGF